MQGMEASKFKGTVDCFAKTFAQEGIGGFYVGCIPRMYRVVPGQVREMRVWAGGEVGGRGAGGGG